MEIPLVVVEHKGSCNQSPLSVPKLFWRKAFSFGSVSLPSPPRRGRTRRTRFCLRRRTGCHGPTRPTVCTSNFTRGFRTTHHHSPRYRRRAQRRAQRQAKQRIKRPRHALSCRPASRMRTLKSGMASTLPCTQVCPPNRVINPPAATVSPSVKGPMMPSRTGGEYTRPYSSKPIPVKSRQEASHNVNNSTGGRGVGAEGLRFQRLTPSP